jgi:hypothetical protein
MTKHWILRVGDGKNFINSSEFSTWFIKSRYTTFCKTAKRGDILWFIVNKRKTDTKTGKVIAVATFISHNKRECGPLLDITGSNADYNIDNRGNQYDVEIHYTQVYNLQKCKLYTEQRGQNVLTNYDSIKEKIPVNLVIEYKYIKKYSKITLFL